MHSAEGNAYRRQPVAALACLLALGLGGCDETPSPGGAGADVEKVMEQGARGREELAALSDVGDGRDGLAPTAALRTPDDVALSTRVRSALSADPGLKALGIEVNAADGAVTLYGTAETRERREKATQIALNVDGVRSVTNHLIILRGS